MNSVPKAENNSDKMLQSNSVGGEFLDPDRIEDNHAFQAHLANIISQPENTTVQIPDPDLLDEFGHLDESGPFNSSIQSLQIAKSPVKKPSAFQSSFLGFLQGKKGETLSSVTNSCITTKPDLPKYIPEPPRPKPKVPPAPPPRRRPSGTAPRLERMTETDSGSNYDDDEDIFEDDEFDDEDDIFNQDCKVVIPKPSSSSAAQQQKVPPLKISLSKVKPPKKSKKNGAGRSKKKEDDIVVRERVSRKAKEKFEQQKRDRIEKSEIPIFLSC